MRSITRKNKIFSHHLVLECLKDIGISQNYLQIFESYLYLIYESMIGVIKDTAIFYEDDKWNILNYKS